MDKMGSLKVPPHSLQAEQSVLGGLMLDNQAFDTVSGRVGEEDFYRKEHRLIFHAIAELAAKDQPFDVITLSEILTQTSQLDDAGGMGYLNAMARETPSAANIVAYADIVRTRSVLRQMIHVGTEIANSGFQPEGRDAAALLEEAEQQVFRIAEQHQRGTTGFRPIKQLLAGAIDRIETLFQQGGSITGLSSGFTDFDEKTSGLQPSDLIIVAGRPSMGKCLGKGTLVLMYCGDLRKVEDIVVGDLLMGDDSTPRRVLSLVRGRENMYWVRQNKGIDYRVNESHILSLKRSREEGGHAYGEVLNIELREYLEKSDKFKSSYQGYKLAVKFAAQETPVEPYFLSLWLGDSAHKHVQSFNLQNKHIPQEYLPQEYLANSRENRLQLLAGLIDNDGHFDASCGGYEIKQKGQVLARQIKFLCDTLGFRTSLIEKSTATKVIGFETTVYRVRFFGDLDSIPVRIERKKASPWPGKRLWNQTSISVELDGVDDYYGFEIDGNGLFLLEDMTVTHNTAFAMNLAENVAIKSQLPVAVYSMEMPGEQLALRMMSSLGRVDQHRVRTGKLEDDEWPRLTSAMNLLAETKLFIDDTAALSPTEVRSRARRLMREHGQLGLIVLDYLQLMRSSGGAENRVAEISEISRSLKALAKELNVPVIALSQLNRNLEQRPNKRPVMSDLRESGCLTGDTLITDAATGQRIPIKLLATRTQQTPLSVFAVDENDKVGVHRLTKAFYSGRKRVYALKTRSGRVIKASANHPFLKLTGWQRLDELRVGDRILRLAESAVCWDEIAQIQELNVEGVYDATVEGVHNFVANDIFVHNSIEQDADIIVFIYRDEVYHEDSPDKGVAEIIIAKQRNGPIGTLRLTFLGRYTKFENHIANAYADEGYL